MSTNPTPSPPGGDVSPPDAYLAPQAAEPPVRVPSDDAVVPWGLLDVIVVVVIFLGAGFLAKLTTGQVLGIPPTQSLSELPAAKWPPLLLGLAVGSLVGFALSIAWLRLAVRATWAEMGLRARAWRSNALLGAASFLVLMVPIFGLQWALNFAYEQVVGPPSQHPLIEHLLKYPSGAAFLVAGFTAVVVAPVTEEFLFRAVFQGWLDRLVVQRWLSPAARHGAFSLVEGSTVAASAAWSDRLLLACPIVFSSAAFALAHWSHGVAWVPLFFFALALGYLYRRTRSLVAPIVLHVSLNASSLMMLWLATK